MFYKMVTLVGRSPAAGSGSNINDPVIDKASEKMMGQYLVDPKAAMAVAEELRRRIQRGICWL